MKREVKFTFDESPSMEKFNDKFRLILSSSAPSGQGYDGADYSLLPLSSFSGETIDEKLTSLFNAMANNSAVQISLTDTEKLGGYQFYGTFYKLSDYGGGYATVVLYGYIRGKPVSVRKSMEKGAWLDYEYDNAPMELGREYRTTERHNGKPVYVKEISTGALPAGGFSNRKQVGTGILVSDLGTVVRWGGSAVNSGLTTEIQFPVHVGVDNVIAIGGYLARYNELCVMIQAADDRDYSDFSGTLWFAYTKAADQGGRTT